MVVRASRGEHLRTKEDAMTRNTMMLALMGWVAAALAAGAPFRGGMVGTASVSIDPSVAKVADAFDAAMNAGDAAAAAAVFAEDGVEMPPDRPAIRGRAAIEQYYREMFAGPVKLSAFRLTHREGQVAGEVAYLSGDLKVTVTPPGAGPLEQAGKYLVVLKRSGGKWLVADAIHNADGPCAQSPR
jgi:uncharacterized protein (TIGR02246 family)